MRKTCPKHGEFVDVMATDPAFLERIESLFFGRDFRAAEDATCIITERRISSLAAARC